MNGEVIWTSGKRIAAVLIPCETISVKKRDTELSSGHFLWSFGLTIRVDGSLLWKTAEVNCLAKDVVISTLRVRNLEKR